MPLAPSRETLRRLGAFEFGECRRNRADVGLRRILGAQHALGLDHQGLDMVARLLAFALLDRREFLQHALVVDGLDIAAQRLVGVLEAVPCGDEKGCRARPLAILSSL